MTFTAHFLAIACFLAASGWAPPAFSGSPVVISEFMANDSKILPDEDGEASDWIELHNRSHGTVNLDGWFLTDSTRASSRWRLPATNIAANGFLIVFASGKDRSVPGRPLHAAFRLGAGGEYLALIMPDGVTLASEFAPEFPQQFNDVSFGVGTSVATTQLVVNGAVARVLVLREGTTGTAWTQSSFDDSAWQSGKTGVGFAANSSLSGSGLYAYWPVRESSGAVVSNMVTGGAHGILNGGARLTNDAARGTVLAFSNGYVAAGTIPRMGVSSNFTWSFWHRQRSVPNLNSVILGNRSGGAPGSLQFIKFTPSNFEYYNNGNIGFIQRSVPTGSWRHLAVVKEAGDLTYYDNGVVVGAARAGGEIEANPLFWGGDPGAPGENIDGLIDDISLWTTALTPEQIRLLYSGVSPSWLGGIGGAVATDLGPQMHGAAPGAYLRIPFSAPDPASFGSLKMRIQYDDGFVAWINGVEVARRNAPAATTWNSTATREHPAGNESLSEEIDISAGLAAMRLGANVLAIHGLNLSAGDSDFLIAPELEAATKTELGWRYFVKPTPGTVNGDGHLGLLADVEFDRPRGFYDLPFNVTLICATPGAAIRYTTNGTEPSATNGLAYQGPVRIGGTTVLRAAAFKDGWYSKGAQAQSYLFLDQVLVQNGAGLPNNWGGDWQMDPRVVTNSAYASRIRDDMKSLPIVSLALDPLEFWGPSGIYTLTAGRGDEYEIPCSAEMFFPDGSQPGFQVNCGIQIVGGASRTMSPKHGVGLTFKSRYGPSKLKYKFFDNSEVDEFDFLAFRPNFNMSWVRTENSGPLNNANADGAERLHAIYVRDQFTKESQLAMDQPSAHERFVHLYINGVYWGLYNPSERTDSSFAASYLGGRKEDYDTIFSDASTIARAHDGDKNAWQAMMAIARQGLAGSEAYAQIQQYLDVTNLADYMMLNFYCATVDWPWQNWNAARKREPGAQFRFFIWDADYTLETPPWVPDDRTGVGAASSDADSPARLYHELRSNAEWRLLFADRVQKHFFNDGPLTTNQAMQRFLRLCDIIDGAIVGESARWGDVVRRSQPYTRNVEWLAEKNRLLTQFFPQRTGRVVEQFIRAGLYPPLPAPVFSRAAGPFDKPFQLQMTAAAGSVYFTTNGVDPRLPGGAASPDARIYAGPITIAASQQVLARAWRTNTWSALSVATFTAPEPVPSLTVIRSGSSALLAWPESAADFILESAGSLSAPQWAPVQGVAGAQCTVNISSGRQFYRLRKQ